MSRFPFLSAIGITLALAGCGKHDRDEANEAAQNSQAPVVMPPAIKESHVYRCKDKTIIYVDFLADNLTANLHYGSIEAPTTRLIAPEAGKPFVGGDYSLAGDGETVTLTKKGGSPQTCKA